MSEELTNSNATEQQDSYTPEDSGIPDDWMKSAIDNDPEYKELIKKGNSEDVSEDDHSDAKSEDLADAEEDSGDGETKEEEPTDTVADDKNSGKKEEGDSEGFADNVIDGLKGQEFGKLSEEAQDAIGSFYQKHTETTERLTETESRLNRLLADPIVKARSEMIDNGRDLYEESRMTDAEKNSLRSKLRSEIGLDDSEAAKALQIVEAGIEKIANDIARDRSNNIIINREAERKAGELKTKGQEMLMSLGQVNPELQVKEKNLESFFKVLPNGKIGYNDKHPEIDKFRSGIGKVREFCINMGWTYDTIVKMGQKSLYAAAAASLGMPVAINTETRDKKILAEARKSVLKPFMKTGATTLSSEKSSSNTRTSASAIRPENVKSGLDVSRLVTDGDYYEMALNRKPGDIAHKEKIDKLVEQGRDALKRQRNKK